MNAKNSLYPAIFTLIGTTIGAGILALPYTFMQSGFLVGAISLGIVFVITLLLNLFYAEILVHVKEKHQFAGYANTFFGRKGKIIATLGLMIGAYGALLAYTIQIGIFLHTLIPSVGAFHFSIGFYIVSSLLILVSLNWFSMIETLMVSGLLLLMGIIIISGVPHITWSNYAQTSSDLTSLLLPYGVLLFAFSGYSVIPEIGQLTDYDTYKL
ncbi:hypothetical protein KC571_01120, partial [candidate division WWE3 bacterium]|nr:hypothetical protein [candidate division WWE3 bacterium]